MWACHNEREEDQRGSPRESRVTVSPCPGVVKEGCPPPLMHCQSTLAFAYIQLALPI